MPVFAKSCGSGGSTSVHIADIVKERMGALPLVGRYHRLPRKIEDDFMMTGRVLGTGFSGSVRKATRRNAKNSGSFAVKRFNLSKLSPESVATLESEVQIYLCMDHPHIARLVNVYETPQSLSLVMECCEGGELLDRLRAVDRFPEREAADVTQQMLLAVHYIHCHGIAHRDLKLENFLYDRQGSSFVKLIDFGFSRYLQGEGVSELRRMKTACGTLSYVAPEVLTDQYTNQCDLWSMGVIVFIMVSGTMPFQGKSGEMRDKITSGTFTMKKERWSHITNACKDFTRSLLQKDDKNRLTAKQALVHPWILNNVKPMAVKLDRSRALLSAFQAYKAMPKFRQCSLLAMSWLLTSTETSQMQELFLAIDKDQQGTISLSDLKELMVRKLEVADADVVELFEALDANHDHEIHYSEFLAALLPTQVQMHDQLLKTTFRNFDTDLSGYITVNDLQDVFGNTFEGKQVESLIKEADFLEDDRVSFPEFSAFVRGVPVDNQVLCQLVLDSQDAPANGISYRTSATASKKDPKCCTIM